MPQPDRTSSAARRKATFLPLRDGEDVRCAASRRDSPTVEVRHLVDGRVEVEISTAYGEPVVRVSVSERRGFNERFAEHEVAFAQRDEAMLDADTPYLIGSEFRVRVPLSTGEKEAVRRGDFI